VSNVAIIGHIFLLQDILYDYGPFLSTFALTGHLDPNMFKFDIKCQNYTKIVIQGQTWP